MGIDLTKLAPAPWSILRDHGIIKAFHPELEEGAVIVLGPPRGGTHMHPEVFASNEIVGYAMPEAIEFVVLAREALDVMMRRGWYPVKEQRGWIVATQGMAAKLTPTLWDGWKAIVAQDPFTALVEADAWYRTNVENTSKGWVR